MDDVKASGVNHGVEYLFKAFEEAFYSFSVKWHSVDHTGMRHEQDASTMSIRFSESHYAENLQYIAETELKGLADDSTVSDALRSRYLSVLGGVAWLLFARAGTCI